MAEKSQHSSILPSYHLAIETQPPPPTYLQSTMRLCYKNQPYISDLDQYNYTQQQQLQLNRSSHSNKRCIDYLLSWAFTIYNRRFVFLTIFSLVSIVILGLIISFISIPSLIKHRSSLE